MKTSNQAWRIVAVAALAVVLAAASIGASEII